MSAPPLAGIRVLDLTRLLPGPMASLVLADLGARVDKLEDPGAGDYLRHMPPHDSGTSGPYRVLNRDKRAGILDLKHASGVATLRRLLGGYDVLLESFRPGVLARLGLAPEALCDAHPRLVVCSISGYGQDGPLVHRAGHDLNYLARAGVLGVTGPSDGVPGVSGAQMADVAGGSMWAVIGVLAALHARATTGRGRVVDVAMCEGSVALAAFAQGLFAGNGAEPERGGDALDGGIAPYNTYATRDGRYVALAALEPKFWTAFCAGAGLEATMDALVPGEHQREWKQKLAELFATRTRDEWGAFGAAHDCCLEPVLDLAELRDDAQMKARGVFVDVDGVPCFRTPFADRTHAPTPSRDPGADSRAILRDAGFDDDEIATLARDGVLGRATS